MICPSRSSLSQAVAIRNRSWLGRLKPSSMKMTTSNRFWSPIYSQATATPDSLPFSPAVPLAEPRLMLCEGRSTCTPTRSPALLGVCVGCCHGARFWVGRDLPVGVIVQKVDFLACGSSLEVVLLTMYIDRVVLIGFRGLQVEGKRLSNRYPARDSIQQMIESATTAVINCPVRT